MSIHTEFILSAGQILKKKRRNLQHRKKTRSVKGQLDLLRQYFTLYACPEGEGVGGSAEGTVPE